MDELYIEEIQLPEIDGLENTFATSMLDCAPGSCH